MLKIVLLLAVAMFTGCSSLSVFYDFDRDADFDSYKRYKWGYMDAEHDALAKNHIMSKRIHKVADSLLQLQGYVLVEDTTEKVDFIVVSYAIVEEKTTVTENYPSYGSAYHGYGYYGHGTGFYGGGWYSPWWGPSITVGYSTAPSYTVDHTKEGTLIIDIVEAGKNELVWRGSASKAVEGFQGAEESFEIIRNIVTQIMANYPPEEPKPVALDERARLRREEREKAKKAKSEESE